MNDDRPLLNRYWYFTKHGVGPGSVPSGVDIWNIRDGVNRNGMPGEFFSIRVCLSDEEVKEYDLERLAPDKDPAFSVIKALYENNIHPDNVYEKYNDIQHIHVAIRGNEELHQRCTKVLEKLGYELVDETKCDDDDEYFSIHQYCYTET